MRNVTLSADEALREKVRKRAESEHTTLNNFFREWLARYAGEPRLTAAAHFRAGRRFAREELNEQ